MLKRRIRRALSYGFVLFLMAVLTLLMSSRQDRVSGIPVLNYHGIANEAGNPLMLGVADFERQMAYLAKEGYQSVSPKQLVEYLQEGKPLPEKSVLITFDDGYKNNYTQAYPIMKKYGLTGTIFLVTDTVGRDDWYLNWDQVREMRKDGFVFGSHTLNHLPLNDLTPQEILFQLTRSKEGIEWRLEAPVEFFAYPTGAYDREIAALVREAGYKAAFTIEFGRVKAGDDLYELNRIPILKTSCPFYHFYTRLNMTTAMGKAKQLKEKILGPGRTVL